MRPPAAGDAEGVRTTTLQSGIHRLDARLHAPRGEVRGGAIVAHPHPRHGGHMDHPVVVTAAERAARLGLLTLRFDFRGVRHSEGEVGDVAGHLDDWRAAHAEVRRRVEGSVLAAGFSYGARTLAEVLSGEAAHRPHVDGVLLIAPATRVPTSRRDFGNLLLGRPLTEAARDPRVLANLASLGPPTQVVVGEQDVVAPHEELRAHLPPHAVLQVIPGLNHFFSHHTGAGPLDVVLYTAAIDRAWKALTPPGPA